METYKQEQGLSNEAELETKEITYTPKQLPYAQGNGQLMLATFDELGITELEVPETLPVLLRKRGVYASGMPKKPISEQEIRDLLTEYETKLGWSQPVERAYTDGEDKTQISYLICNYPEGEISIDQNARVMVNIYTKDEEATYSNLKEYILDIEKLQNTYASLLPEQTQILPFCDRNIYHDFSCSSRIIEKQETVEQSLIQTVKQSYVIGAYDHSVFFSDDCEDIEIKERYPIKSIATAIQEMYAGNYYKAGGSYTFDQEDKVAGWELSYKMVLGDYCYPFYTIYLDTNEIKYHSTVYQMLYVPAMNDDDLKTYQNEEGILM